MTYIAVRTGVFATKPARGSYQVYKLRENGGYSVLTDGDPEFEEVDDLGNNYPRCLEDCKKLVITLNERS